MYQSSLASRLLRLSTLQFFMRVTSVLTLGLFMVGALTGDATGPDPSTPPSDQIEIRTASLSHNGVDHVITGSIAPLFETTAFVGFNKTDKTDRLMPKYNLMAVAEQFSQARIRLAALNTGPVDPARQQSIVGELPSLLETPDEAPRMSVASLDDNVGVAALRAIDQASAVEQNDPSIPQPLGLSEQLAYARDSAPSTERVSNPYSERERWCLSTAIYFEARGESYRGQVAVAQVILNRVDHSAYPSTICGVVFQNATWRNRCQFSFACDGIPERINDQNSWKTAEEITQKVTSGVLYIPEVSNATHYHATYVYPHWAPRMTKLTKIGLHIFYRFRS